MTGINGPSLERFLIAVGVALAVPLTALAFGGAPGEHVRCEGVEMHGAAGPHGRGEMVPPQLRGLALSEGQRDKVFEIMHAQAPAMRDKAKAWRRAEDELRGLATAADYSEARAQSLTDAAARAMAEMAMLRAKTDRQLFEVLTPEQRKQLAERKPGGISRPAAPGA